jgi:hypothetical protein
MADDMTRPTVDKADEQTKANSRPEKERQPTPPPNATPLEKLLWTPTPGEDATRLLFPLSRRRARRDGDD